MNGSRLLPVLTLSALILTACGGRGPDRTTDDFCEKLGGHDWRGAFAVLGAQPALMSGLSGDPQRAPLMDAMYGRASCQTVRALEIGGKQNVRVRFTTVNYQLATRFAQQAVVNDQPATQQELQARALARLQEQVVRADLPRADTVKDIEMQRVGNAWEATEAGKIAAMDGLSGGLVSAGLGK